MYQTLRMGVSDERLRQFDMRGIYLDDNSVRKMSLALVRRIEGQEKPNRQNSIRRKKRNRIVYLRKPGVSMSRELLKRYPRNPSCGRA
jgi:hypothetical protein